MPDRLVWLEYFLEKALEDGDIGEIIALTNTIGYIKEPASCPYKALQQLIRKGQDGEYR